VNSRTICMGSKGRVVCFNTRDGVTFPYDSNLVDPASSICLSQRLSHACLSISIIQRNCEWLIKTVMVYLIIEFYMDNRGNSRANTCWCA
jgi:hypothetical protein